MSDRNSMLAPACAVAPRKIRRSRAPWLGLALLLGAAAATSLLGATSALAQNYGTGGKAGTEHSAATGGPAARLAQRANRGQTQAPTHKVVLVEGVAAAPTAEPGGQAGPRLEPVAMAVPAAPEASTGARRPPT